MTRKPMITGGLFLAGLTFLATSLTGCAASDPATAHLSPSPELFTRARTYDQNMNDMALTFNRDLRSAVDDVQRVFLIDRASKQNPTPNPW